MENTKFVFTTGAPGSMWSMISHKLKKSFRRFDTSDEAEHRQYSLPDYHKNENYNIPNGDWKAKTHIGSYFGPDHEFGHHFDDLNYYTNVDDFYQECLKPFSTLDNTQPMKLIKSHWFAYNLDWLWNNCKGHNLFLILREPEPSRDWWYSMGGWDIKHPVYTWYKDDEKMWKQIQEECRLTKEFGEKINATWYDYDENNSWIQHHFNKAPRPLLNYANPKFTDTIKVAYIRIK
jgi:hypothetical protein